MIRSTTLFTAEKPKVSICCSTYNHGNFIGDALDGILMQKCNFPVEVLIHEDCSTDNTAGIIKEYQKKFPGLIKPEFQKENQYSKGIKPLFQLLLPRVNGKYIALCEGDDFWTDSYKLQKQVDFLEKNPNYSMCFHNAVVKYEMSSKEIPMSQPLPKQHYNIQDIILISKHFIPTGSMFFRASALEIPEWFKYVFSGDYSIQLVLASKGAIYRINEFMSVYRKHHNGISSNKTMGFWLINIMEILSFFNIYTHFKYNAVITERKNKIIKYLSNHGVFELPLWRKILIPEYYLIKISTIVRKWCKPSER